MKPTAIVVGGGLGGLATALTLSTHYDVKIFEKNSWLGGKMQSIQLGEHTFDFGPNTLTMPRYFWDVLAPFVQSKEALPFQRVEQPTAHRFKDATITFTTDVAEMQRQIALVDPVSAENYPAFILEITRLFHLSEKAFLNKTFFNVKDYTKASLMKNLMAARPFQTLDAFLGHYFPNKKIRQLFNRFATYIGSSPYETPATFAMIAYFELVEGTYFLEGGPPNIAATFERVLCEQGVKLHLNEPVLKFAMDGDTIRFCETEKGRYEADIFVSDMDYDVMQSLLGRKIPKRELSTSAYVELIALKEPVDLHHHNVLFSNDYVAEFKTLREGNYARKPSVYGCYPYASDSSRLPALFVLINAPANLYASQDGLVEQVDDALQKWGIKEEQIVERKALPPHYIADTFAVRQGAIYGQASNTWKGSFFRPSNHDLKLDNLYYVGGTVHPGGGSPIVVKGGYEVAKRIIQERQEV